MYQDIYPRRPGRDNLSRRVDGQLEWHVPWTIWLIAGIMAVLMALTIGALAGPSDACVRSRLQAPHVVYQDGETRHAAHVTFEQSLMNTACGQ